MGLVKQLKAARQVIEAALVEDEPMTKKVADAVLLVATTDYAGRIEGKIIPSTFMRSRYYVVLTIDARYTSPIDGTVYGGFETAELAYPRGWQDMVDQWRQNYEETGSWLG